MAALQTQVSLLLDHGHPDALVYPPWKLVAESAIVQSRVNAQLANVAALVQMAISASPNMGVKPAATKRAAKEFQDLLQELVNGKA